MHLGRNLAVGVAAADQAEDGDLRGVQRRPSRLRLLRGPHPLDDLAGDLRRQHGFAPMDGPDALLQAEALYVLDDVPASPGLQALLDEVGVGVGREDHDRNTWMRDAEPAAHLDAAYIGQAGVEENHVRSAGLHELNHSRSGAGLAYHLQVGLGLEHRHEALPDHLVIVHDQDSYTPVLSSRHHGLNRSQELPLFGAKTIELARLCFTPAPARWPESPARSPRRYVLRRLRQELPPGGGFVSARNGWCFPGRS